MYIFAMTYNNESEREVAISEAKAWLASRGNNDDVKLVDNKELRCICVAKR